MRNEELRAILKSAQTPRGSETRKVQLIEKARLAFLHQPSIEERTRVSRRWIPLTALSSVAVVALIYVGVITDADGPNSSSNGWGERIIQSRALVSQVSQVFPNGVQSIVLSNEETEIVPIEGTPTSNDLVVIEFEKEGQQFRVIARSGEVVKLLIGSKVRSIEPMVTGEGRIIVTSEDDAWRGDSESKLYGYSVRAERL